MNLLLRIVQILLERLLKLRVMRHMLGKSMVTYWLLIRPMRNSVKGGRCRCR